MSLSRRHFLQTAGAVSLGFAGLQQFFASGNAALAASAAPESMEAGFGPLKADPSGIMDLPEGFSYKIISRMGDRMTDGLRVPGACDGMAAFNGPDGKTIIIRNHEVSPDSKDRGPFGDAMQDLGKIAREALYDYGHGTMPCLGGTSNILFDTKKQTTEAVNMSLAGTIRNCAGGPTPWNTWLTCEEPGSNVRAGEIFEQDHGYVFEVPAVMGVLAQPVALKGMGRFNHEAVAVDPKSGIVYQTEDRHEGLIYRYIPAMAGRLHMGGKLQALVIKDEKSCDTRNWEDPNHITVGQTFDVEWMDVQDVEAPEDDLRVRGFQAGAARFARGEGMWYGNNAVYFACTNGGSAKKGQIWKYTPSPQEGQSGEANAPAKLELFLEPNDGNLVDNADNLTVSPWGDLVLCEDGSGQQFLVGVTPKGKIYKFARNAISDSELAGACFSPDGSTLFVNIQHDGLTLAITGPWKKA